MASKRDLKKAIYRSCGDMAGECIYASEVLAPASDPKDWDNIIIDIAMLQTEAINRVSVDFDHKPSDFENGREYRKARKAYFREVANAIGKYMSEQAQAIATSMNQLLPKKGN